MAKISILTCANATQDLGCSSASCLANFRKRKGTFAEYPEDEKLTLAGIINCPGCPTLTGPDKLIGRIRALTDFGVDTIHFSYCVKALCLFKEKYKESLEESFPNIRIMIGIHEEHITPEEFHPKNHTCTKGDRYYIHEGTRHSGNAYGGYADITFFAEPTRYTVKKEII